MFWMGLILGIIIGWIIEWMLDWWFWRGDMRDIGTVVSAAQMNAELSSLRAELESQQKLNADLEANISALEKESAEPQSITKEIIKEVIKEVPVEVVREVKVMVDRDVPDDLKKIKGIGKVYEGILNSGGINTFAELAAQSDDQIQEIIGPDNRLNIDVASWISQAKDLAAQTKGEK